MTEKEMDQFFISVLKKMSKIYAESLEHIKDYKGKAWNEIKEAYVYCIEDLEDLCENLKTINDLGEMDEETIEAVYEYLCDYEEGFIISSDPEKEQKDLKKYDRLDELLGLFYDEDDEDFEDEE